MHRHLLTAAAAAAVAAFTAAAVAAGALDLVTPAATAQDDMRRGGVFTWPAPTEGQRSDAEWQHIRDNLSDGRRPDAPGPAEPRLSHVLVSLARVSDGLNIKLHDFGTERACEEAASWIKRTVEFQWSDRSQDAVVTCLPKGRLP
jgi:hypothetical protein